VKSCARAAGKFRIMS